MKISQARLREAVDLKDLAFARSAARSGNPGRRISVTASTASLIRLRSGPPYPAIGTRPEELVEQVAMAAWISTPSKPTLLAFI